jgi:hypothetical protein
MMSSGNSSENQIRLLAAFKNANHLIFRGKVLKLRFFSNLVGEEGPGIQGVEGGRDRNYETSITIKSEQRLNNLACFAWGYDLNPAMFFQ